MIWIFFIFISSFIISGCSVNLNNISIYGTACDVIDEAQSTQPEISADIPIS